MLINKVIFWGLCATLVFVPLPFGLTEEWGILVFEVVTLLLFSLYLVKNNFTLAGREEFQRSKIPFLLKILFAVFAVVVFIQLIPMPLFLLKILSPNTYETYNGLLSEGLGVLEGGAWRTLSLSPDLSLYEVIKYICYFVFGFLILKCVKTKKDIEIFILVLILCAVFQSFYGLTELLGGTERIFGYKKVWYIGSATGTYINRNHFSGFLEMIFPISLGYLLVKADFFSMEKGMSLKEKILWFGQERLQKSIVLGSISVLLGIGIFFSRSRSGIFIFFLILFLMIIVLLVKDEKNTGIHSSKKRFRRIIRNILLVVLFSAVLIGIKPIIERFSWGGIVHSGRPTVFKDTVDLIQTFPLFGTGIGTYVYAYPMVEKIYHSRIMDHAHNDYLELLAENGLIGGGCLILLAFLGVGYVFVRWRQRRDPFVKGVGLGCLLGIVAILIHSVSDFNLQIPANAIYFVTLYGLGMNTVNLGRDDRR